MMEKPDVLQGTLALMALKTLDILGPQHGDGIARRVDRISIARFFEVRAEDLP
jgi:PadR family transcriptional regulator PadR